MAKIIHTTLIGQRLELVMSPELGRLYDKILAAPSGGEALALALGWDPLVKHPFTPMGRNEHGVPNWSALVLQEPGWAYLQDAVARCRAAHGELDVGSTMRAATWTVAEAARSLGVSEDAVRVLIRTDRIQAMSIEGGRYLLDRRGVEAHETTGTRGDRTTKPPALYARHGVVGDAALVVRVVDSLGLEVKPELVSSVDGVDEAIFEGWAKAVIHWGKAGKARAVTVKPAHARRSSEYAIDGLAVVGRFELLDTTNNRGEAAAMLDAFVDGIRVARRG